MAKTRHNRPDTPLAPTPSPTPLYLQTQVSKEAGTNTLRSAAEEANKRRTAQKNAEKAINEYKKNDSINQQSMRDLEPYSDFKKIK